MKRATQLKAAITGASPVTRLVIRPGLVTGLALATALLTASAQAGHGNRNSSFNNNFFDYANVVSATPLYETVVRSEPSESCWNERVQRSSYGHRGHGYRGENSTPVLIGALLGGALGNELGHHKRNKQVGAVIGGLLGGSIGRDVARNRASNNRHADSHGDSRGDYQYETVQRCETTYRDISEQQLVGYDVSYRYRGQIYDTRTSEHPGKRMQLQVSFSPVAQ